MSTVNQTVVTNFVARQMGEFHENDYSILATANRKYEKQFNGAEGMGYATGAQINIKIPGYPNVTTGLSVSSPTAINDTVIPFIITENDIYNVTYQWDLFQFKFDLVGGRKALTGAEKEALVDNYAYPAHTAMATAQEIVANFRLKTNAFYCSVSLPSQMGSVTSWSTVNQINKKMSRYEFKNVGERYLMMNLDDAANLAGSIQNMFNEAINGKITKDAYINGDRKKSRLANVDLFQSNQIDAHVSGALSNATNFPTITVENVSDNGLEITLNVGGTSSAQLVNAGDMFAIPSVNLLKPIEFAPTQDTLVVTAQQDAFGDGAGHVTIILPYPLMITGFNANVESLPAPSAPVLAFPEVYNLNYAYVPSGLSMCPVRMSDVYGAANSMDQGLNDCPINVILQGQVLELSNVFRLSQMIGIAVFAPYVMKVPTLLSGN